jgi:hypothetical protein
VATFWVESSQSALFVEMDHGRILGGLPPNFPFENFYYEPQDVIRSFVGSTVTIGNLQRGLQFEHLTQHHAMNAGGAT